MKVLDSDFLIALLNRDPAVLDKLEELHTTEEIVTTTIFNAQEEFFGAVNIKNQRNIDSTRRLLASLPVLEYGLEEMHHVTEIIQSLAESGLRIGFFDEMIAGICVAQNATLVTRNLKHFRRVNGLKLEKW